MPLELAHQVHVVVRRGAALIVGDFVNARRAEVAAKGHDVLFRMTRHAKNAFEQLVDVVNELAVGDVDEFHRAVAAAAQQPFAIHRERRGQHPVAVIIELHQFLAIVDRNHPHCFVLAPKREALAIG